MGLPSKVAIHLGDVTAHVKLVTAVEKDGSGLKMVCDQDDKGKKHDPAPVAMPAICTHCGKKGNRYSFPRGRETDKGLVIVTAEELQAAQGEAPKEMVITAHPLADVLDNTFPGESNYLLVPSDAMSVEAYSMIRQALIDNPDKALTTTYAVQSAAKMWRLGAFEDGLSLTELAWPENVKARPAIPKVTIVPELREMANEWMAAACVPFDPANYRDTAKAAREALVAAKAGDAVPMQPLPDKVPANVSTSLMDRLKASVEAAKASKAPAPAPKKSTAKKAAAKKTVAKTA